MPRARGLPLEHPLPASEHFVSTSSLEAGTRVVGSRTPRKTTVGTAEHFRRLAFSSLSSV